MEAEYDLLNADAGEVRGLPDDFLTRADTAENNLASRKALCEEEVGIRLERVRGHEALMNPPCFPLKDTCLVRMDDEKVNPALQVKPGMLCLILRENTRRVPRMMTDTFCRPGEPGSEGVENILPYEVILCEEILLLLENICKVMREETGQLIRGEGWGEEADTCHDLMEDAPCNHLPTGGHADALDILPPECSRTVEETADHTWCDRASDSIPASAGFYESCPSLSDERSVT